MFQGIVNFFKKLSKKEKKDSSNTAKERLHLVLMQDRANVSADFLELMRKEIIEVIKKYIDIDEKAIDVKLTNKTNEDGTVGAPALYANIPIITIKNDARKMNVPQEQKENKNDEYNQEKQETIKEEKIENQSQREHQTKHLGNIQSNETKQEQEQEQQEKQQVQEKQEEKQAENKEVHKENTISEKEQSNQSQQEANSKDKNYEETEKPKQSNEEQETKKEQISANS